MDRTWWVVRERRLWRAQDHSQSWSNWLSRFSGNDAVSFRHSEFKVLRVYSSGDATEITGHPTWIVAVKSELRMCTWEYTSSILNQLLKLWMRLSREEVARGPTWESMGTRMFRGRVTLADHGKGLAKLVKENIGKKDVTYTNRKRFVVLRDLEQVHLLWQRKWNDSIYYIICCEDYKGNKCIHLT